MKKILSLVPNKKTLKVAEHIHILHHPTKFQGEVIGKRSYGDFKSKKLQKM